MTIVRALEDRKTLSVISDHTSHTLQTRGKLVREICTLTLGRLMNASHQRARGNTPEWLRTQGRLDPEDVP